MKGNKNGKMFRPYLTQTSNGFYGKIVRMKNMDKRPSKQKISGIKSVEKTPANSGVQKATCFLKKLCGSRPGHIIQIPKYQFRALVCIHIFPNNQQLSVPVRGSIIFC